MAESFDRLIRDAKAGDRDAMQELLCAHFDRLLKHIEFRIGEGVTHVTGDDILQETFVHAVRDISKCRSTTDVSFFAWLKGVADNRLRDEIKHGAAKKRGGDRKQIHVAKAIDTSSLRPLIDLMSESLDTPSMDVAVDEAAKAMHTAVMLLPDDQRDAILLRYIDGLELAAVAEAMDRSPDAVRGLLHRGKSGLRDSLGNSSRWFSKR